MSRETISYHPRAAGPIVSNISIELAASMTIFLGDEAREYGEVGQFQ